MSRARMQAALDRVDLARGFTKLFLASLTPDEWFRHPPELTTHIAWQVAHLSVAQYRLCLERIRGRAAADDAFMPASFVARFQLGSQPVAGAENNPLLAEIQRVFDAVHEQSLAELGELTDEEMDVPLEQPRPMFKTKLGAVEWCAQHEFVHAGQIALLRRLMGKAPLR
jgi:DinB family protein